MGRAETNNLFKNPGKIIIVIIPHLEGRAGDGYPFRDQGHGLITPELVDIMDHGAPSMGTKNPAEIIFTDTDFRGQCVDHIVFTIMIRKIDKDFPDIPQGTVGKAGVPLVSVIFAKDNGKNF